MELVLALLIVFLISVIFGIGFIVGAKHQSKSKEDSFIKYKYDDGFPVWTPPTSSVEEVPAELLMGGNIEKALHIAGVKEASWETQKQWADERKAQVEEKSALSDKQLMEYIEAKNEEILVKAGIKQYDRNKGVDDLTKKIQSIVKTDDIDEVERVKLKAAAARKQAERDREDKLKIDFEALNFSRISNEARKQITEIVKKDIANKLEGASNVLPEVKNENNGIGKKPKTQTDYQNEHKKPNPKQFNGIESDKPFVKTRKIDKTKVTKGKIKDLKK